MIITQTDDKLIRDNYRPVSLMSSISKLFEKVAYDQLYAYFTTNKLFTKGNTDLKKKHSTELANIELLYRVLSALNDKKLPASIFMDLSKDFDTLDHQIILNKWQYYGINGTLLCWFISYLSSRTQYVEINHVISSRSYNAHTGPLFKQPVILKISDMLRINSLKYYHKHQHVKLPNYFLQL